jgi:MFS superfamily sulfate permease-like transporter
MAGVSELSHTAPPPPGTSWLVRSIPALSWLRSYQRAWLRPDMVAGITLAAYLLPAGLGDASLATRDSL